MPLRRSRRCGKRMACCMASRRPCIDSLPRYCMPPCPLFKFYSRASNSSQSDCSCSEENYCTVENCRNAPMCISTLPLYCPYGSYQGHSVNQPTSSRIQRGANSARANDPRRPPVNLPMYNPFLDMPMYPPGWFYDPPFFPPRHSQQVPPEAPPHIPSEVPPHIPSEVPPHIPTEVPPHIPSEVSPQVPAELPSVDALDIASEGPSGDLPDGPSEMSFRLASRNNFLRNCPETYNEVPQYLTSTPASQNAGRFEPHVSPLHRTPQLNIPHWRPRVDYSLPPYTHFPTADLYTSEREIVSKQGCIDCNQSHDRVRRRDEGRPSHKYSFLKRVRCAKHGGTCRADRSCSQNYAPLHITPDTCNDTGRWYMNGAGPGSSHLQNASHHGVMDHPGNLSCYGHTPQTVGTPNIHLGSCPPLESPTFNVPDFNTSAANTSAANESKCLCRYPPLFKHLRCAGNISGSCSCDQK